MKDGLFWFMFVVFLIFGGINMIAVWVFNVYWEGFNALMILWGLAFGFQIIHAMGYEEGLKHGTKSNKTESE